MAAVCVCACVGGESILSLLHASVTAFPLIEALLEHRRRPCAVRRAPALDATAAIAEAAASRSWGRLWL